jgi:hypothetical protein
VRGRGENRPESRSWHFPVGSDPEETTVFEDQKIELLPARTTMRRSTSGSLFVNQSFNYAEAVAVNAGNVNVGGDQLNLAAAIALAGSNVG